MSSIYLLYFILGSFFIVALILLLIDYNNNTKGKESNLTSYLHSQRGIIHIQLTGIIITALFGITAIIISAITSNKLSEQIDIENKTFLMQIEPIIKTYQILDTNRVSIIGIKIKNEGVNDILNLRITKDVMCGRFTDGFNNIDLMQYSKDMNPNYIKELHVNDSIKVMFNAIEIKDIERFIRLNSTYKRMPLNGILAFNISYNRFPDMKQFNFINYYTSVWDFAVDSNDKIVDSSMAIRSINNKILAKNVDSIYSNYWYK
ncbi:MAG: hypothetical protein PHN88_09270 [Ignavibacteria bacterium]|nr:hypothetical protein [Ignavibacteria bacterium]